MKKKIMSLILACVLLATLIPAVSAAGVTYTVKTSGSNLNVRSGPSTSYSVIGSLANGTKITVYSISNGWASILYNNRTGYVSSSYLTASANTSTYYVKTSGSNLNVRSGPSTSYSVIGSLANGTKVAVYSISNGWASISYNNRTGYVSSSYLTTSNATTKLSYGLYKNTSARISCGFDGYITTSGRHEGIDITCYNGAPVYALTSGTVVRVAYGSNGSNGLSTIAIYDSSTNKTVIYLHTNPLSLKEGQSVSKGQQIATQGWRGVSSASAGHTHVEVRAGRQGYAAKSVGDYTLDNQNPTSYWTSKGYSIQ